MDRQIVSPNAGVSRQSLPYTEPILKPNVAAQTARAQARSTQYYKTNILQRMLVQMTDWVKSRVSTIRIASALEPFIRKAAGKGTGAVSADQVKALNNALASAQSVKNGSDKVVSMAVSHALGTLDRKEKAAFREQLLGETALSGQVRDGLLYAVTASLHESISADADSYVLAALDSIATMVQVPFLVEDNGNQTSRSFAAHLKVAPAAVVKHLVSQAGPYFNAHLQVVSPSEGSVYQGNGVFSLERQIACLSSTTKSKVQSWFSAQPKGLQKKVAAAIKQIVDDRTVQAANAPDSAKRTRAFCIWFQQTLDSDQAS